MTGFISNWSQCRVIAAIYAPRWLLTGRLYCTLFLKNSIEHLKYLLDVMKGNMILLAFDIKKAFIFHDNSMKLSSLLSSSWALLHSLTLSLKYSIKKLWSRKSYTYSGSDILNLITADAHHYLKCMFKGKLVFLHLESQKGLKSDCYSLAVRRVLPNFLNDILFCLKRELMLFILWLLSQVHFDPFSRSHLVISSDSQHPAAIHICSRRAFEHI